MAKKQTYIPPTSGQRPRAAFDAQGNPTYPTPAPPATPNLNRPVKRTGTATRPDNPVKPAQPKRPDHPPYRKKS